MREGAAKPGNDVILSVEDLSVHFSVGGGLFGGGSRLLRAVEGVNLQLKRGECLGLVGESGSGKSTVALSILGLQAPTRGRIVLDGQVVTNRQAGDRAERARAMLARVGLRPEHYARYPHMFSGGQRQRVAIARALMLEPKVVVADEPVSALDVSIQAQVLNLLMDLQQETGVAYVFISHNLAVVELIADEVLVMYLGRVMERAPKTALFAAPRHPYTRALLASTPKVGAIRGEAALARAARTALSGELPSPLAPPSGCVFRTRCPHAIPACAEAVPPLVPVGADHEAACIRLDQI